MAEPEIHDHLCTCRECIDAVLWRAGVRDRRYTAMASTGRTSRPAPMSARNVRIRLHDLDCMCSACQPFLIDTVSPGVALPMRLFVWVCQSLWYWTPAGQLMYWAVALSLVASHR